MESWGAGLCFVTNTAKIKFWRSFLKSRRVVLFTDSESVRFLMERLRINYHWQTNECLQLFLVQLYPSAFSLASLSLLRTSRSGVGALL